MANNFFQIISPKVNYDFVGFRKNFLFLSAIALIASFALVGMRGLNFGLDFRGGTEVQLEFIPCSTTLKKNCISRKKLKINQLRKQLGAAFPGSKLVVQQTGEQGTGFLLKFDKISSINDTDRNQIKTYLKKTFGSLLVAGTFRKEGGNKIDLVFSRKLIGKKKKVVAPKKVIAPKKAIPGIQGNPKLKIQELLRKLKLKMKNKGNIKIIQPRKAVPVKRAVVPVKRAVAPVKRAVAPAPVKRAVAPAKRTAVPAPAKRAVAPVKAAPKKAAPKKAAPAVRAKPMYQESFAPAARRAAVPSALGKVAKKKTVKKAVVKKATVKKTTAKTAATSSVRAVKVASLLKIKNELKRLRVLFAKLGLGNIKISKASRRAGNQYEYSITFAGLGAKLRSKLEALYGAGSFKILQVESVGPSVGDKLRADGITSIFLANLFILIYISIRFDFRYAPGAVAALLHDVFITTGVFSALFLPFDLAIIAALLTIIGYSLNDTIVVYDRIRENWQKSHGDFGLVMNRSINETLSRTLLTSITTFLAVLPIFIIGGDNIKWFAFAMMFGILIGTYSSIAIASPIVYLLDQYFTRKEREEDQEVEEKRERRRRRRAGISEQPS